MRLPQVGSWRAPAGGDAAGGGALRLADRPPLTLDEIPGATLTSALSTSMSLSAAAAVAPLLNGTAAAPHPGASTDALPPLTTRGMPPALGRRKLRRRRNALDDDALSIRIPPAARFSTAPSKRPPAQQDKFERMRGKTLRRGHSGRTCRSNAGSRQCCILFGKGLRC